MSNEPWYSRVQREAGKKLTAMLDLPNATNEYENGAEGYFDPWEMFPLYGSYCGSFDQCAIEVLRELQSGEKVRDDLGAEMFREMLCNLQLCDYGSSPRVCFPTPQFKALLPKLIDKWEAYSFMQWGEKVA